jgi:cyclophilin family peptidyl-prolyl cis-trans isomerase
MPMYAARRLFAAASRRRRAGRRPSLGSFDRRVCWSPRLERLESRLLLHGDGDPEHALTDHIHAQLDIFVDGVQQVIPGNIGIDLSAGQLVDFLHTHETGGRLHQEPIGPGGTIAPDDFVTVGDFFDIWRTNAGSPGNNPDAVFNANNILGNTVNDTHTIRMFVNGEPNDEFENYRFHDGDAIVISFEEITNTETVTLVNINTSQGVIPIELFNVATPLHVANFLNYVNDGDYVNSLFHRSARLGGGVPFVIQGGGFNFDGSTVGQVPTDDGVMNEPGISNTLGTIALAKQSGNPNSGTNQWFVNLRDNSGDPAFLDTQNGGFTVFGRVIGDGMDVVNAIAALDVADLSSFVNPSFAGAFMEVPVVNFNGPPITANELVLIQSVTVVTSSIEGVKFQDVNANGTQDAGENGLAGWMIYADANDNGALDAGETSAVTDATGHYLLDGLSLGTHIVREVLQSGWAQTAPAAGFHSVTIGAENGATGIDFGNVQVTAPTGLTLSPSSDTGVTGDGLTRLNNSLGAELQFSLGGLIPGATVTLVDTTGGETILAQETATATIMDIITNGTATLANGPHAIVARQSLGGTTSGNSNAVNLTIDAAPPVFTSMPILQAPAGLLYEYNVQTDDEAGTGVNYDLQQAVTGMVIDAVTGVITWTPTIGQVDTHTITVRAIDGADNSGTQTFMVEVTNSPPVLDPVSDQTVDERAVVTFTATATDPNLPGDALTFSLDGGAPMGATIDPATGLFTWTTVEENGPGVFPITVRVTDQGGMEDFQQFTVTVNELNDAPTIEPIANRVVIVDTLLNFSVMATDPDQPPQTLTFSLIGAPAGAAIDPDTGEFTWTPNSTDSPGTYMMEVRVSDGDMEAGQMFTVFVQDEAFDPVLQAIGDQTIDEGTQLVINVVATDDNLPNDALIFSLDAGAPAGAAIDPASGDVTWTPDEADGPGMFPITVRVTDASGGEDTVTFNITVNEVNVAPVIESIDDMTADEGDLVSFTVNATDADLPANTLTYSLMSSPTTTASIDPATGEFTWQTTEDDGPGMFTFTVQVSDGVETVSESFTITVEEVNQPPVLAQIDSIFVDEGGTVSFFAEATDPDRPENTLIFSFGDDRPTGASIDPASGDFTWITDEADGPGTFMVTVIVRDGAGGEDSQVVSITVNEINTPPVLDPIDDETIPEGQLFTFTATASDADQPMNNLTFSLDAGAPVGVSLDPQTGVFTWTPSEAQGPDQFTVTIRVNDNTGDNTGDNDSRTFTLTVTEVDSPPVLDPIGQQTVNVGGTVTFTATASDPDIPQNNLTFSLDSGAPAGATIDPQTGAFSWTPTAQQGTGFFDVTVRVTDDTGLDDFEDIRILVNTPPVIDPIGDRQIDELTQLSFTVTADDDDTFTFRLGPGAPAGAAIDPQSGLFTWTPTEAQGPGTFDITVIVEDSSGLESEESFEVDVREVNRPPVINSIGDQLGMPGTEMQFTVTATDPDLPANNLRFSLDPGSPPEAMIDPVTGLFWWTIPPDITDTRVTFTVRVTDDGPGGMSTTQSFDVLLTNVGFSLFSSDGAAGLNESSQIETVERNQPAAAAEDDNSQAVSSALLSGLLPASDDVVIDSSGSNFAVGPDTGVPLFWQTMRDGPMPGVGDTDDDDEEDNRVGDTRPEGETAPRQASLPSEEDLTLWRGIDDETIAALADVAQAPMAVFVDYVSELVGRQESDSATVEELNAVAAPSVSPSAGNANPPEEPADVQHSGNPRLAAAAFAPLLAVGLRPAETPLDRGAKQRTSLIISLRKWANTRLWTW